MILDECIKQKKTIFANTNVKVFDNKIKNITTSGNELKQIMSDMASYTPLAAPNLVACTWVAPSSGSTPSDQNFSISSGANGPIIGLLLSMSLGSNDTPRHLDFSITAVNNTRGTGYTCQLDHIICDLYQPNPQLVVLFSKLNGKNRNSFASADTVTLVLHTTCALRDGDLIKVETIDVGHPLYEEYLAEIL